MKVLSVVGTAAMFLVGGSILAHGLSFVADVAHVLEAIPFVGTLAVMLLDAAIGVAAGILALVAFFKLIFFVKFCDCFPCVAV